MIKASSLQKYALFGGLLEDQIDNILHLMAQEVYNPGDVIINEGKSNDRIFFIMKGQVEVKKKEVTLTHFNEGDAFGEMEILDVMPAVATIKAVSEVTVMTISNRALRAIYNFDVKTFSLIIMNLARDLSRRLRKMDESYADKTPLFAQ